LHSRWFSLWDTNSDAESGFALGIIKYTNLHFARLGASFALWIIRHGLILARHSAALPLPIRDLATLTRSVLILLTLPVWVLLPLPLLALVALFRLRLLLLVAWVVRVVLHCYLLFGFGPFVK